MVFSYKKSLNNISYPGGPEHLRACQVALAEHFYQLGQQEEEPNQKEVLFHRANVLLTGTIFKNCYYISSADVRLLIFIFAGVNHGLKRKNHDEYFQQTWDLSPGKRICTP